MGNGNNNKNGNDNINERDVLEEDLEKQKFVLLYIQTLVCLTTLLVR